MAGSISHNTQTYVQRYSMLALSIILHLLGKIFSFPNAEFFNEKKKPCLVVYYFSDTKTHRNKLSTDTRENKVPHFLPVNF